MEKNEGKSLKRGREKTGRGIQGEGEKMEGERGKREGRNMRGRGEKKDRKGRKTPPAHPLFRDVMYHIVLMPSLIKSQNILMVALKILCFSMLSSTFLKLLNKTHNNDIKITNKHEA